MQTNQAPELRLLYIVSQQQSEGIRKLFETNGLFRNQNFKLYSDIQGVDNSHLLSIYTFVKRSNITKK